MTQEKFHKSIDQANSVLEGIDQCINDEKQRQGVTEKPTTTKSTPDASKTPSTTPVAA